MDISVILSSVTAILAIVVPIVATIVNNHFQLKNKYIDVFYQQKFELYKKFSNAYGKNVFGASLATPREIFTISHEVMIVCNENIRKEILLLNQLLLKNKGVNSEETDEQFNKCCELLHKELNSYYKHPKKR